MDIRSAEFVCSNTEISKLPNPNKPEYAFIGRSNVGKSSLINMITQHKGLAKTSQNPGKTRLINHFIINDAWYLVDLPGYGFARASKNMRSDRENLSCVFILLDSRLEPQKSDLEMIDKIGAMGLPMALVATKADKINANQYAQFLSKYTKTLQESWEELPPLFKTSATDKTGKDEILAFIEEANQTYFAALDE
jgi:GTP-binding protein